MIDYRHRVAQMSDKSYLDHAHMLRKTLGFKHSGFNLVHEINSLNPQLVIDVGCGVNLFKNEIENLIGFDVCDFTGPDYTCAIEDMIIEPESADVILALGSLQYTNRDLIHKDISKITSWLRPNGFIVVRNTRFVSESDSVTSEYPYRWSQQWFDQISEEFGLVAIKGPLVDSNSNINADRLVWWWQKQ